MNIFWAFKPFSELNLTELYQILALRQKVFMLEQQDIYLDADGKDLNAIHVVGYSDNGNADKRIIAYARIIFPESNQNQQNIVSFGRVIVDKAHRGNGLAKILIQQILDYLKKDGVYSVCPIKISAQAYLIDFYKNFGFETLGEIYLDGTIPHIDMILSS